MVVITVLICAAVLVQAGAVAMLIRSHARIPKLSSTMSTEADGTPLVSIVVPARNEIANIERCLRSLVDQDYASFEVIVVDDESVDGTHEILARIALAHARVRVVDG